MATPAKENLYRLFNHFLTNDKNGNKRKLHSMSAFLVMMQSLGLSSDFIYEELSARKFVYVRSAMHVRSFHRTDVPTDFQPWHKWISGIDDKVVVSKKGYVCFGELFGIPEKVCIWEYEARERSRCIMKPINDCLSDMPQNNNDPAADPAADAPPPSTSTSTSLPQLPSSILPIIRGSPQNEYQKYLRKK